MKLTLDHIKQLSVIVLVMIVVATFYHSKVNERKTAKIIHTINLMKGARLVDSLNTIYVIRSVDSLKAKTARQEADIINLKGKLWHEKQATKHLEKSINDLLVIVNERPSF